MTWHMAFHSGFAVDIMKLAGYWEDRLRTGGGMMNELAALLLVPFFYRGGEEAPRQPAA